MNIDAITSYAARGVFLIASLLVVVAFVEWVANLFGLTILMGFYTAGRLVELAAALLVFVIAVLLRQVRDALRAREHSALSGSD